MDLRELENIPPWEWPEDTEIFLRNMLSNKQEQVADRLLAAEFSGEFAVLCDELAETLLSVVEDGDDPEELRSRAAISLGPALDYCDTMEFEDAEQDPISEQVFSKIQDSLRKLYEQPALPPPVRRSVLEAAVRAPQDWQKKAVRAAYYSDDRDWRRSAVFCMRFVSGFEKEITESLQSNDADIHYQAVLAAGAWQVDRAWKHITKLAADDHTEKALRLAAIEAVAGIRPREAAAILTPLLDSGDDDLVDAAYEALSYAEAAASLDELDEEDDW